MAKSRRRSSRRRHRSRKMRGGACPLALSASPYDQFGGLAPSTQQSIAQGAQFGGMTRTYHGGFRTGGEAYGVNLPVMGGGRRRRSRRRMRGGMAPLDYAFGPEGNGAGVARDMAHLRGGDMAMAEAAAFSRTPAGTDNPGVSQAGGRRRRRRRRGSRRMRGGAIYEGAPYSQNGSNMLLADDPALAAQAAKLESPTWIGVAKPAMIAAGYPAVPGL
jgi:hypothetical protein